MVIIAAAGQNIISVAAGANARRAEAVRDANDVGAHVMTRVGAQSSRTTTAEVETLLRGMLERRNGVGADQEAHGRPEEGADVRIWQKTGRRGVVVEIAAPRLWDLGAGFLREVRWAKQAAATDGDHRSAESA